MRKVLLVLLAAFVAASGFGQEWAKQRLDKSPRHREWVYLKNGDRKISAYVVYPEVDHKAPAIVVIHEIFGMTDWVQLMTDELAAAGYVAIAPDLLSGVKGLTDQNAIGKAIRDLSPDQITSDLNAVADYVSKLPASNGTVAVVGFCWGGGEAFRFATNRPSLAAAYVFYGIPPAAEAMKAIHARVYGFYAGNDMRIGATVPSTIEQMRAAGKAYEPVSYEGAGHGFMRAGEAPDTSPANKKARDDAWARLKSLLAKL